MRTRKNRHQQTNVLWNLANRGAFGSIIYDNELLEKAVIKKYKASVVGKPPQLSREREKIAKKDYKKMGMGNIGHTEKKGKKILFYN